MATRRASARFCVAKLLVLLVCLLPLWAPRTASALDPARSIVQYYHSTWSFRDGIRGPQAPVRTNGDNRTTTCCVPTGPRHGEGQRIDFFSICCP